MSSSDDLRTSLFVYGTLIHPHILSRVLSGSLQTRNDPETQEQYPHLQALPAILKQHELRRVKGQEYPAIIRSDEPLSQDPEQAVEPLPPVRGILVRGFTHAEITLLDRFEGDEYIRVGVEAIVPANEQPISNVERAKWTQEKIQGILDEMLPVDRVQSLLAGTEPSEQVSAETYLWVAPQGDLELRDGPRGPWEFSLFSKSKSDRWTGGQWTDHGGPDGLAAEQEGTDAGTSADKSTETPSTPIVQDPDRVTADGKGGIDEVRRVLEYGGAGSSSTPIFAGEDPWADPPPAMPRRKSDNPWADDEEEEE